MFYVYICSIKLKRLQIKNITVVCSVHELTHWSVVARNLVVQHSTLNIKREVLKYILLFLLILLCISKGALKVGNGGSRLIESQSGEVYNNNKYNI